MSKDLLLEKAKDLIVLLNKKKDQELKKKKKLTRKAEELAQKMEDHRVTHNLLKS
jgi:hypothetical protein